MPNKLLLLAAGNDRMRALVSRSSLTRGIVHRFVAGEEDREVVGVARRLAGVGLQVTIDHLGEGTTALAQAEATRDTYLALLWSLHAADLATAAEVSLKVSALGGSLPGDGYGHALRLTRDVCAAAAAVGSGVTIDMEDHTTVDATLSLLGDLRAEFPWVGVALQACLRRTADDCRRLAHPGSRVRLVKGAYAEPASVAFVKKRQVDDEFRRCLRILMEGQGYPMIATHDPKLIEHTLHLARQGGRSVEDFEFQMLYGIRENEQLRLASGGNRMRVYLPYGRDWYAYFMRRLAEKPANLLLLARSFTPGSAN
ncbi:proline dehydrogenase family protein [Micromonospora sp. NPDC047812]|uniref:proline dehydrogenase family protein n=1 Tax=Micromonospora sp. NPDC047812 TaxID=3155742 RepID=UPI0034511A45